MYKSFILIVSVALMVPAFGQAPPIQWQRSLGGSNAEELFDIQQTADGGYVMTGYATSNDGDVTQTFGEDDLWVVKLDSTGTLEWEGSFGGSENDRGMSIRQTPDGGYIVGGITWSNDGDVTGHHGDWDIWILRLNSDGDLLWQRCLGGPIREMGAQVALSPDGGFFVGGSAKSSTGDLTSNNGEFDFWIMKLAANGDLIWQKNFGGSEEDWASGISGTADGGVVVTGYTYSANVDVTLNQGWSDAWVIKLASNGDLDWKRTYGGSSYDGGTSIEQTPDGGYVMSGSTMSSDGDLTANNGGWDMWVLKLDPSGDIQWQTTFGGTSIDIAMSVSQTSDGDYIVAGHSDSGNGDLPINQGEEDLWLIRLDATGDLVWQRSFGGSSYDWAAAVQQTSDGGYILGGTTASSSGDILFNNGFTDFLVVKFAASDINTAVSAFENDRGFLTFPNPTQDLVMLEYQLERSSHIRIHLYDELGQELLMLVDDRKPAGTHNMVIPFSDLSAGVYHLRLILDEQMVMRRLVKL